MTELTAEREQEIKDKYFPDRDGKPVLSGLGAEASSASVVDSINTSNTIDPKMMQQLGSNPTQAQEILDRLQDYPLDNAELNKELEEICAYAVKHQPYALDGQDVDQGLDQGIEQDMSPGVDQGLDGPGGWLGR